MNISIEEMPREIARLEDENERLQEELDKTRLSELDKEYRINKAIKYIEEHRIGNEYSYEYDLFQRNARTSDLLNILKGSDKE